MSFAEIRRENGYLALYIDGLRTPPLTYALTDTPITCPQSEFGRKNIPYFYDIGINIISVLQQY